MQQNLAPIHVSRSDAEELEIFDLIHMFSYSADFADWITDGKYNQVISYEHLQAGRYMRIYRSIWTA